MWAKRRMREGERIENWKKTSKKTRKEKGGAPRI
jgi:hypothetical protein